MRAPGSGARFENNRIFGYAAADCKPGSAPAESSVGMHVLSSANGAELDAHSNDIDGGNATSACTSAALAVGVTATPPASSLGIYRNNILRAGSCTGTRHVVREDTANADPRVFENNDLDPYLAPAALYRDEASTLLTTAAQVNALTGMIVSGNISQTLSTRCTRATFTSCWDRPATRQERRSAHR